MSVTRTSNFSVKKEKCISDRIWWKETPNHRTENSSNEICTLRQPDGEDSPELISLASVQPMRGLDDLSKASRLKTGTANESTIDVVLVK